MRFVLTVLFIACLTPCSYATTDVFELQSWLQAIQSRDCEKLKDLLPSIGNVDLQSAEGKTALMVAATKGDMTLLNQLLKRNAKLNITNNRGGTALMYAAANNQLQTVLLLLKNGADINMRAENGWTALTLAAAKGNSSIVSKLLISGANPNIPDVYGWTALMRAIEHNHYVVVEQLASNETSEIDRINNRGQSALHVAASMKRCDMIKLLVSHRANTQLQDFRKRRPEYNSFCTL